MYFVVAGGGEVGYHLSKALLEAGHEVMIIERDRKRALWIEEQLGSVVINAPADEGRFQIQAGCQRADAVLAVTGDDEDNLIISQLAKLKCGANRVIARVNNPKNEIVFKAMGIDETLSSTRVLMGVIEQELPTGGFMPLMPLTRSDLEIVEAEIAVGSPAADKEVEAVGLPAGAHIGAIVRKGQIMRAHRDTKLEPGDRIIVFAPTAAEQEVKKALFG
jgi:trk system potassium uptake protein TrkA